MSDPIKRCPKCEQKKSFASFYRDKTTEDGYRTWCKTCHRKWQKVYYLKNKDKHAVRNKQWKQKNKERVRFLSRRQVLKGYGLTSDQYDILLESQNGVCAVCKKEEIRIINGKVTRLAVHHDHETGRVQGLLCAKCNTGLGFFNDNPQLVNDAAIFINRFVKE